MNKKLDNYLQKLDYELRLLPAERRGEELREIRQHLEAIVARLMEGGISEEEATEAATSQFGRAREVGQELVKVVPMTESPVRLLAASVCAIACYLSLNLLLLIYPSLFAGLISERFNRAVDESLFILTRMMYAGNALVFFLIPLISAVVFRCLAPNSLKARSGIAFWLFSGATFLILAAMALG